MDRLSRSAARTGEGREIVWQLVMVTLVLLEVAVRASDRHEVPLAAAWAGVVAAATTLLMVTTPREGAGVVTRCTVVGLGNLLALGLLLATVPWAATGVMVVLPLIYLGRLRPMRGVAYAALSVPTLYLGPSLVTGADGLWRPVALALAGVVASLVVAATCWHWERTRIALGHQEGIVSTLVETVDVGLVLMDETGRYRLINPRHHDFIELAYPGGYRGPEGSCEGHVYLADRVTPVPPAQRPSTRAAAGEEFSGEVITVGEPGTASQRAVAVSARSVHDETGHRRGAVLAYHDITAAMQALNAKDDFIAMVSHELRTPLTSITGYLDLAASTPGVPTAALAHLEVAERNCVRMTGLVTDLLHSAGASDGSLEVVLRPVLLHLVVAQAVEDLRPFADRHGVTIVTDLAEVPVVSADALRLSQVVANLVSNAVKYSGTADEVTVQVCRVEHAVRIAVVDRGTGMTTEEVGEAFSRFFRAPSLSDQSIQGIGLGLPISRSIVDRHAGRIWLESSPGRGTTAVVELPSAQVDEPDP